MTCVWLVWWDLVGFCLYFLTFLHVRGILILFSCMLFLVRFKIKTQKIKGKGRLYLCEEKMEWQIKGCVTSFIVL